MIRIFPLLLATLLMLSGCGNNDDILFEMVYEREFVIPAGLNTLETHYFYLDNISVGSYLTSNNVTADELRAINPGTARMSTIFSGLGDYSFIRDVSIEMFTDDEARAKEIFWLPNVQNNTGEDLDIFATLVDTREFFEFNRFNVFVKLRLREVPAQTIETRFRFSFFAK